MWISSLRLQNLAVIYHHKYDHTYIVGLDEVFSFMFGLSSGNKSHQGILQTTLSMFLFKYHCPSNHCLRFV